MINEDLGAADRSSRSRVRLGPRRGPRAEQGDGWPFSGRIGACSLGSPDISRFARERHRLRWRASSHRDTSFSVASSPGRSSQRSAPTSNGFLLNIRLMSGETLPSSPPRFATRCSIGAALCSAPLETPGSSRSLSRSSERTATSSPIRRGGKKPGTTSISGAFGTSTVGPMSLATAAFLGTRGFPIPFSQSRPTFIFGIARSKLVPQGSSPEATNQGKHPPRSGSLTTIFGGKVEAPCRSSPRQAMLPCSSRTSGTGGCPHVPGIPDECSSSATMGVATSPSGSGPHPWRTSSLRKQWLVPGHRDRRRSSVCTHWGSTTADPRGSRRHDWLEVVTTSPFGNAWAPDPDRGSSGACVTPAFGSDGVATTPFCERSTDSGE